MRARDERPGRLVEADVAVHAEPEDLQVDAAGAFDRALVAIAFALDLPPGADGAVQKVDAAGRQVDVIEQVLLHERAVAPRIVRADAEELVEVERRRAAEIGAAGGVVLRELAIQRDRRPARRQPEDERGLRRQRARDVPASARARRRGFEDAHARHESMKMAEARTAYG